MKVIVTGAAGQLGSVIVDQFRRDADVIPLTRGELDISKQAAVMNAVGRLRPDAVVNCAGYNHVDAAEDDPVAALEANALGVRCLARAAATVEAVLVHYSTDFVFDGAASRPYTEEDGTNPASLYAHSKLLGEWFARDAARHYVLRVESLFGGAAARSSVDRIIRGIREAREVKAFADRWVSPSYVVDVARATRHLLATTAPYGLYHCVNSGYATWVEVASEVARLLGREARIAAISVGEMRLRAPRPQFCALSNAKLQATGATMPPWQDALRRYLQNSELNDEFEC